MVSNSVIRYIDNWVCDARENGIMTWLLGTKYTALPRHLNILSIAERELIELWSL